MEALTKDGYGRVLDTLPPYDTLQMCQTQALLVPMFKIGTLEGKVVRSLSSHGLLIITEEKPDRLHSTNQLLQEGGVLGRTELVPPFCWLGSVTVDSNYLTEEALALAQYYLLRWAALRYGDPPMLAMEVPDYDTLRSALNTINRYKQSLELELVPGPRAVIHVRNMRSTDTARGNSHHLAMRPAEKARVHENDTEDRFQNAHLEAGVGQSLAIQERAQVAAASQDLENRRAGGGRETTPFSDEEPSWLNVRVHKSEDYMHKTPGAVTSAIHYDTEADDEQRRLQIPSHRSSISSSSRVRMASVGGYNISSFGGPNDDFLGSRRPATTVAIAGHQTGRDWVGGSGRRPHDVGEDMVSYKERVESGDDDADTATSERIIESPPMQENGGEPPLSYANPHIEALKTLRESIGEETLAFLPPLEDIRLDEDLDDTNTYLPMILLVATYEDAVDGKLEVWAYLKPDSDPANGPSLELTAWSSDLITVEGIEILETETPWRNFFASVSLYPPFKSVSNREQFDAVVTYYFLLAAEAGVYEPGVHSIPASYKLRKSLGAACNSVAGTHSKKKLQNNSKWEESRTVSHNKRGHSQVPSGSGTEDEASISVAYWSQSGTRRIKKYRPDDPVGNSSRPLTELRKSFESWTYRSPSTVLRTAFTRSTGAIRSVTPAATKQKMPSAPGLTVETRVSGFETDLGMLNAVTPPILSQHELPFPPKPHTRTFSNPPTSTELEVFDLKVRQLSDRIARCSEDAQIYFASKEAAGAKLQEMVEAGKKEEALQWLEAIKSLDKNINEKLGVIRRMVEEKKAVEGAFSKEVVRESEYFERLRSVDSRTSSEKESR